jgi:hypothetical protein
MTEDDEASSSGAAATPHDEPARGSALEELLSHGSERDLLVRRYLLGYLSEDEAEAFEARFVHDRGLLDELEEAERFIAGLRQVARDGRLADLRRRPARAGVAAVFRSPRSAWLAAAAGLVVAVGASFYFYGQLHQLRAELAQLRAPQVNTRIVDLEIMRGRLTPGTPARTVVLPAEPSWIVLAMDTGSTGAGEHRARLLDSAERVVAESSGLLPDDLGIVYWSIHSSTLRQGDYHAELRVADGSAEPEVRYAFRVIAPS